MLCKQHNKAQTCHELVQNTVISPKNYLKNHRLQEEGTGNDEITNFQVKGFIPAELFCEDASYLTLGMW